MSRGITLRKQKKARALPVAINEDPEADLDTRVLTFLDVIVPLLQEILNKGASEHMLDTQVKFKVKVTAAELTNEDRYLARLRQDGFPALTSAREQ